MNSPILKNTIMLNIETLCDMRANGASYSVLSDFCGCSVSRFRAILASYPDIRNKIERAYLANLNETRKALLSLAVGGRKRHSQTIQFNEKNEVVGKVVKVDETLPDLGAIKTVLRMAGELEEVPTASVNIDARTLADKAMKIVDSFNLEVRSKNNNSANSENLDGDKDDNSDIPKWKVVDI